jgi:hypothetical protein
MVSVAIYLLLGLAVAGRSLLEITVAPDYWDPRTLVDHLAVWSYSLCFLALALALLRLVRDASPTRLATGLAWLTAGAALLTAVANAVEDAFGVTWWGSLYVASVLTTVVGLLVLGGTLWIKGEGRWAIVVTCWLIGFAGITVGLGFVALLGSLVAIDARRRSIATA